jgi:DNA-directed RNA polymerase I, II, and III subunit RPABC2
MFINWHKRAVTGHGQANRPSPIIGAQGFSWISGAGVFRQARPNRSTLKKLYDQPNMVDVAVIPESSQDSNELKPIKTSPYLTKYEKARILGTRAMQIAMGAPVRNDQGNEKDPLILAEEELARKDTPLIIRRPLPNGEYEDVAIRNLEIFEKRT